MQTDPPPVTEQQKTDLHPSGLSWERWRFPFKTPEERDRIRRWLAVNNLNSDEIPF